MADLALDDIQSDAVLGFLDHVESRRGNSAVTRNCRLAAVRSFVQHLLRQDVTRAGQYGRILAIRNKKALRRAATYLEPEEARAVIAAIDQRSRKANATTPCCCSSTTREHESAKRWQYGPVISGWKDHARCGCSAKAEGTNLPALVRNGISPSSDHSRGRAEDVLFRNTLGAPLTRDGVAYLMGKYVRLAARHAPALRKRRVTPHVMRHSCAVALLQAGVDVSVIRDYLGHASVATTSRYITTNLQMKREVLEAFWKRAGLDPAAPRKWRPSPKLLAFLENL